MKKLYNRCIKVMGLILLMLVLTSCATKQKQDKNETPQILIVNIDGVYFPSFPYPEEEVIIPLDKEGNIVLNDDSQIEYIKMPYWYWLEIIEYVVYTENAVEAITAAHPP